MIWSFKICDFYFSGMSSVPLSSLVGEVRVWLYVEVQSCAISLGKSHSPKGLTHHTVYIYCTWKQAK